MSPTSENMQYRGDNTEQSGNTKGADSQFAKHMNLLNNNNAYQADTQRR
jgi:hypothetical protein